MKKTYIAPTVEMTEIETVTLLANSIEYNGDDTIEDDSGVGTRPTNFWGYEW